MLTSWAAPGRIQNLLHTNIVMVEFMMADNYQRRLINHGSNARKLSWTDKIGFFASIGQHQKSTESDPMSDLHEPFSAPDLILERLKALRASSQQDGPRGNRTTLSQLNKAAVDLAR